ncbi:MAG: hypothetical protein RLZZ387_711 [Chloroflexota bacterium]|jgi:hypothetical protein
MDVLVDPIIFTLPDAHEPAEVIEVFLAQLALWSAAERKLPRLHDFIAAECCVNALMQVGRFPYPRELRQLLRGSAIETFDAHTAFESFRRLLENIPYFEERAALHHVLIDPRDVQLAPDLAARQRAGEIAGAVKEALGMAAYAREVAKPPAIDSLVLATHPVQDTQVVQVAASAVTDTATLPVTTDFPIVTHPDELQELIALSSIWENTPLALDSAVWMLKRRGAIPQSTTLISYRVVPEFNESIRRAHIETHPDKLAQIFQRLALLLSGGIQRPPRETDDSHKLQGIRQRSSDSHGRQWEPWRLRIRASDPPVRLHYWWHDGKCIVSNIIVDHDRGTIYPVRDFPW